MPPTLDVGLRRVDHQSTPTNSDRSASRESLPLTVEHPRCRAPIGTRPLPRVSASSSAAGQLTDIAEIIGVGRTTLAVSAHEVSHHHDLFRSHRR